VIAHGLSGGGPSAYCFAIRHPDKCMGLIASCALTGDYVHPHGEATGISAFIEKMYI